MKHLLALLLAASLTLGGAACALSADILPFSDVDAGAWYYGDVLAAWRSGLINGTSASTFSPDASLTYAEAVKLAACMHQLAAEGEVTLEGGSGAEWYLPYVSYCREHGIISSDYAWKNPAERCGYMEIFSHALPEGSLAAINDIPDGSIPDLGGVPERIAAAVYMLYRAGVVQGTGDDHACNPFAYVKRSEVAAILTRMTDPGTRIRFSLSAPVKQPEHKVEVIDGATYVDGILVVNKSYSIPASYAPGDLTWECRAALDALSAGAAANGLSIYLISGYRSYDYQLGLYNRYVERDGQAEADRYSARAGHSEHQTGLAVDVNSLDYSFADTPEGQWLAAHCHEYGFILRYPEGKEEITGYRYEPWHIRYLGVETAAKVAESGLTLEEYLGVTSFYAD